MNIVKIQRFSPHDGKGIRTVVFTKGCPLRCAWCHNPETWLPKRQIMFREKFCISCGDCLAVCPEGVHEFKEGTRIFHPSRCVACGNCVRECVTNAVELVGTEREVTEIMAEVMRDYAFFGREGGITVSGGEPMLQPHETLALLRLAKQNGITTAVETCGYFDAEFIKPLCNVADTLLWDIKDCVNERHKLNTGVDNRKIINNLLEADKYAKNIVIRCILLKGVNDDAANFQGVCEIYNKLDRCSGVQLIPYHAYAGTKAEQLGYKNNSVPAWIPDNSDILRIKKLLSDSGVNVIC